MFIICFYEDILMIFDSIILKLKGIMYLVYCVVSKIHLLLFIIAESCKLYEVKLISYKSLYQFQSEKEDRYIFNKNY